MALKEVIEEQQDEHIGTVNMIITDIGFLHMILYQNLAGTFHLGLLKAVRGMQVELEHVAALILQMEVGEMKVSFFTM